MSERTIKGVIQKFLRTGDHDPLFLRFPSADHLDRIRGGHSAHNASAESQEGTQDPEVRLASKP